MYAALKAWHERFADKIEILLYPSDEFGGQELPTQQIPSFVAGKGLPTDGGGCTLMAKVKVNGPASDPVWSFAKEKFPVRRSPSLLRARIRPYICTIYDVCPLAFPPLSL